MLLNERTNNTGDVSLIPPCHIEGTIGMESKEKPLHTIQFPRRDSEPCLWFLLCLKWSMQCSLKVKLSQT